LAHGTSYRSDFGAVPVALKEVASAVCADKGLTLVGPVGAGAFKETFHVRAEDGASQALKVFRPGVSPQRTQREIRAMLRCIHPNIGRLAEIFVFKFGSADFLISIEEYLPGGTLTDWVKRRGLLSPMQARSIGAQLIDAVGYIASLDLVHRDLKPDNVVFRDDGITPVILDFGLVRDLADSSLTATWLPQGPGTPFFASPEQLVNDKHLIDWRSDQFSLGVLLSVCTLGFHPFAEIQLSDAEIVERVAQRAPQCARFRESAMSIHLPVLVRMTAPWPVERARTPEQLAELWQEQTVAS
jgi:serine/threonine protein kinase